MPLSPQVKTRLWLLLAGVIAALLIAFPTRIAPRLYAGMSDQPPQAEAAEKEKAVVAYLACECGCCGGVMPRRECVADQTVLDAKIAEDKKMKDMPHCAYAGCSTGVEYRICD